MVRTAKLQILTEGARRQKLNTGLIANLLLLGLLLEIVARALTATLHSCQSGIISISFAVKCFRERLCYFMIHSLQPFNYYRSC